MSTLPSEYIHDSKTHFNDQGKKKEKKKKKKKKKIGGGGGGGGGDRGIESKSMEGANRKTNQSDR